MSLLVAFLLYFFHDKILISFSCVRLTEIPDTRIPNAATYKFEREDHTLGNLLRSQLLQDSRVIFAAYKVEHPLFANFLLKIQTEDGYTPEEALKNACSSILRQISVLRHKFKAEYDLKAMLAESDDI